MTRKEIARAKEIDLETYLRACEPEELVKCGSGYRTRTHDSLKISNGLWHWHSRGIGGKTALDYLIHVPGHRRQDRAGLPDSRQGHGFHPGSSAAE